MFGDMVNTLETRHEALDWEMACRGRRWRPWRYGRIDPVEAAQHQPWQRFEREAPNELWQMDFKGHFPLLVGRCHPFTVLDDHSRFCLGLEACANERGETVRGQLVAIFRRYGLPIAIVAD